MIKIHRQRQKPAGTKIQGREAEGQIPDRQGKGRQKESSHRVVKRQRDTDRDPG